MRQSLYDYCTEHNEGILLRQWHPTKNEPLTPKTVTYGSRQKVWCQCKKGHTWQATVYTRTGPGSGCPVCAGRVKPGRLERYAALAAERATGPGIQKNRKSLGQSVPNIIDKR